MSENKNCLSPFNRTTQQYVFQLQNTIPNKFQTNFMISIDQPTSSKSRTQKSPYSQNGRIQLSKSFHSHTPNQDLSKQTSNELKSIRTQAQLKNKIIHHEHNQTYNHQNYHVDKLTTRICVLENELSIVKKQLQFEENEHQKFKKLYYQRYEEEDDKDSQILILKEKNNLLESKLKHMKKNYYQHQQIIPKYDDNFEKIIIHLKDQITQLSKQVEEYKVKQFQSVNKDNIRQLQEEIKRLKQNEATLNEAIQELKQENQDLTSMNLSFENQKHYFQSEIKKLQDYFNELVLNNEKLAKENDLYKQQQLKLQEQLKEQEEKLIKATTNKEQSFSQIQKTVPTNIEEDELREAIEDFLFKNSNKLLNMWLPLSDQNFAFLQIQKIITSILSNQQPEQNINENNHFNKDLDSENENENAFFKQEEQHSLSKVESADFRKNKEINFEADIMKLTELQQKSNEIVNVIEQKRDELENADQNDNQLNQNLIQELEELDKEYEDLQIQIQQLSKKINDEFQEQQFNQQIDAKQSGNMSFQYSIQDELF